MEILYSRTRQLSVHSIRYSFSISFNSDLRVSTYSSLNVARLVSVFSQFMASLFELVSPKSVSLAQFILQEFLKGCDMGFAATVGINS